MYWYQKIINQIKSWRVRIKVELLRGFIHSWRIISGAPFKRTAFVTDSLLVGGQFRYSKAKLLKDWDVAGVVSMRVHYPKLLDNQEWFEFLNLPTKDWGAPSNEDIQKGVKFIQKHIKAGKRVYVHCQWGEGRGPLMAAMYLMSQGMNLDDALSTIKNVRPIIKFSKKQLAMLKEMEKTLVSGI